jgi:hypothetical protein
VHPQNWARLRVGTKLLFFSPEPSAGVSHQRSRPHAKPQSPSPHAEATSRSPPAAAPLNAPIPSSSAGGSRGANTPPRASPLKHPRQATSTRATSGNASSLRSPWRGPPPTPIRWSGLGRPTAKGLGACRRRPRTEDDVSWPDEADALAAGERIGPFGEAVDSRQRVPSSRGDQPPAAVAAASASGGRVSSGTDAVSAGRQPKKKPAQQNRRRPGGSS